MLATSSQKHDLWRRSMGSTAQGFVDFLFFADPMFALISEGFVVPDVLCILSLQGKLKLGGIPEAALESWLVTRAPYVHFGGLVVVAKPRV